MAFLATYIVGLWLRMTLNNAFERRQSRKKWELGQLVILAVRRPFILWFLLLGISIAIQVSVLSAEVKSITAKAASTLFVLSLGWVIVTLICQVIGIYLRRAKASRQTISMAINVVRITFIIVGALIVFDIWGMHTTPLLLLIVVVVLGAALALRNAAPDLFAGFQLSSSQPVKMGDYIKLETGEEGYVTDISWSITKIKALDESTVVVPNSRLLHQTLVNYGHPLKKASEPFHFYSHTHLTELTGLQAKNLRELVDILKKAPDSVIHYHTHRFLEEHHYLTPEPSNDFGLWVSDSLGEDVLGESLAAVNTFEFPDLGTLKERLIGIIEERLAKGSDYREAMPGREFYFMKSISVVLPTPYFAHDLREFLETLRKISTGALYFHVFESRFRLGKGLNDFSNWIKSSLGEEQLGEEISRLDPYTYTLEGLRLALIQIIEKRIQ